MMKRLTMIESIYNLLDFGVYVEMVQNAKKKRFQMAPKTFLKHLFFGRGYKNLTPPQLETFLKNEESQSIVIDLREKKSFKKEHIPGAILYPFDNFLGNILMDGGYEDHKNQPIILVCDTGQKSRVAASVLIEEGFSKLISLKRGMRRWHRWEKLKLNCQKKSSVGLHFCGGLFGR
ncbi:MAG: rhodanese-like domain-containing protein [Desulfobacula sp.]|nr:rhodanese-like domain-containing protein [Desulfobacula sp.]